MELWDIKASALRLMFADTDINFDKEEFENGSIYENGNTREKLVRMNDSIRRAIDLYYHYNGQNTRRSKAKLMLDDDGKATNVINVNGFSNFEEPSKVELLNAGAYDTKKINLSYFFDRTTKKIEVDFSFKNVSTIQRPLLELEDFEFLVYYKATKINLPSDDSLNELTFDLNYLNIPEDIQRMIPKYIKGELYEEDEYATAMVAKEEYLRFLIDYKGKFSSVQSRTKSIFRRE